MSNREWYNIILYQFGYSNQPLSVESLVRRLFPGGMKRKVQAEWTERLRMHCILLERRGWIESVAPRPLLPTGLSSRIARCLGLPTVIRQPPRYERFIATEKLRSRLYRTKAPSPLQLAGPPVAAALLAQACTTQPISAPTVRGSSLEHYHAQPRRAPVVAVEQFPAGDGGGVYRMCTTDCPRPTPKTVGRAAPGSPVYGAGIDDGLPTANASGSSPALLVTHPAPTIGQSEALAGGEAPAATWQRSLSSAASQSLVSRGLKQSTVSLGGRTADREAPQPLPKSHALPPPPMPPKPLPSGAGPTSAVPSTTAVGNAASGLMEGRFDLGSSLSAMPRDHPSALPPSKALLAWAEAWSARTPDAYFDMYARDFKPQNGWPFNDWKEARGRAMLTAGFIDIQLEPVRASSDGSRVTVRAWQTYRSSKFKSRVLKDFAMVIEGGAWKIQREAVVSMAADSGSTRANVG